MGWIDVWSIDRFAHFVGVTHSMILLRLLVLAALNGWMVREGLAPRYDLGVMPGVANTRGLTHTQCMVSSDVVDIGEWVYVYGVNTGVLMYCKVVDASEAIDKARHIEMLRFVEISFRMH